MNLDTTHCTIAVQDCGSGSPAVIFIHGNSSCKEIFAAQLGSPLRERHRLVALDLPGHGESADARDPHRTYTIPGYASVLREVLGQLAIDRFLLVGWSLGGHIAIELMATAPRPLGVVITGTPPFARSMESIGEAFLPTPHMQLTTKPVFTDEEALAYARATSTPDVDRDDFRYRAARRTDGRARARMFAALSEGLGVDQRRTVEEVAVPLLILNGENDPFVNPAYFDKPHYARLWRGAVQRIPASGHAPFYEQPALYNRLLEEFVADCAKGG
jgi:pimeloyl-ACP methyl ester carboxylesterase